ncbi:hypothetical protein [Umezawaea tangerina]|uniref:hypothetical protein n=1 Tax=Umezawaea tangerina TaxID=84725 RepID=UPI000D07138C
MTRISVGQFQVPFAANRRASSRAFSSSKLSTASRAARRVSGPASWEGLTTIRPSTLAATLSANGIRNGGVLIGPRAPAARRCSSWHEQPVSRPIPGPTCSIDRKPASDAARTSMPAGRWPTTGTPSRSASTWTAA